MKKTAILLSMIIMAACSNSGPSKDGENQLSEPAQNSGPATEADRAIDAAKDSTGGNPGLDTLQRNTLPK
ncbi:MAG: hypothetical protein ABI687_02180 [Flavitalea sp.]